MVAKFETLSESVDLARIDRKLADKIEAEIDRIRAEIAAKGYADVTVDEKTYRITRSENAA